MQAFKHRCFPVKFVKLLKRTILKNIFEGLLFCILCYTSYNFKTCHTCQNLQEWTHYNPVLLCCTSWKHKKTLRFSNVFRGYRKATPGCNWLNSEEENKIWLQWKSKSSHRSCKICGIKLFDFFFLVTFLIFVSHSNWALSRRSLQKVRFTYPEAQSNSDMLLYFIMSGNYLKKCDGFSMKLYEFLSHKKEVVIITFTIVGEDFNSPDILFLPNFLY